MEIGNKIRAARRAEGLSQEELARRADMSLNGYANIERGLIPDPHYSSLNKIAAGLGMSVAELLAEGSSTPKAEALFPSEEPMDEERRSVAIRPVPQTMSELLDHAHLRDRELEMSREEFADLFENLSYKRALDLAWRTINARNSIEPVIQSYLETATDKEARVLERLRARAAERKMIAILEANEAANQEAREAHERGDTTREAEIREQKDRLRDLARAA